MINNSYVSHINKYFNVLLELKDTADRISLILKKAIKSFEKSAKKGPVSGRALIIKDWSNKLYDCGERLFPTGKFKIVSYEDYVSELENHISYQYCLTVAQTFEALESLLKDLVFQKTKACPKYYDLVKKKITKKGMEVSSITRATLPGGEKIFHLYKKACSPEIYEKYVKANTKGIDFKIYWEVMGECRHAIVHSSSSIKREKIPKGSHWDLFNNLFEHKTTENGYLIKLDKELGGIVIKRNAEFGFQLFKMLCLSEGIELTNFVSSNQELLNGLTSKIGVQKKMK